MAQLSAEDRARVWRGLMRYWSNLREACALTSPDLLAAINATDTWIDDNQVGYNQALPAAAQISLTPLQKTLLFCAVAMTRVDPGLAAFLRRALGTEVD